jgi:hypothetical protein
LAHAILPVFAAASELAAREIELILPDGQISCRVLSPRITSVRVSDGAAVTREF